MAGCLPAPDQAPGAALLCRSCFLLCFLFSPAGDKLTRSENREKKKYPKSLSAAEEAYLHGSSKPPPTGRRAVSCVPHKAAHPGARALALCPEAAADQEACFSHCCPFLGAYPLPPSVPSVHSIPVSSRDICSFLPGSVPWRGNSQVHAIPPSPTPTITSIGPVSKLRTPGSVRQVSRQRPPRHQEVAELALSPAPVLLAAGQCCPLRCHMSLHQAAEWPLCCALGVSQQNGVQ